MQHPIHSTQTYKLYLTYIKMMKKRKTIYITKKIEIKNILCMERGKVHITPCVFMCYVCIYERYIYTSFRSLYFLFL